MVMNGRNNGLLLGLLFLLSSCILGTSGLYEDQDGKYNWYEQHVGLYSDVIPCAEHGIENTVSGGFLVSTADGVLARLSNNDGTVVWRLVLTEGERILPDTLSCGVEYATFASVTSKNETGTAHILRASSGMHIWEDVIHLSGAVSMSISSTKRGVLIAAPGMLQFKTWEDGRILWKKDGLLHASSSDVRSTGMAGNVVVTSSTSQEISLIRLQQSDGAIVAREDFKNTHSDTTIGLLYSGVAHAASDGKHVCFVLFESDRACVKVVSDDSDSIQRTKIVGKDTIAVSTATKSVVVHIDPSSKSPTVRATFDHMYGVISNSVNGAFFIASSNADAPGIFTIQESTIPAREPNLMQYPLAVPKYLTQGGNSLPVAVGLSGTRMLVQFSEGTTLSFERDASKKVWQRSESLAHITQCMFSELPPSNPENEEEWHSRQPSLAQRLFVQLLILKTQLGMGRPIDTKVIEEHRSQTRDILRPTRDIDGFRKQMIVVTGSGKVVSLHSGNGAILWQVNFPGAVREMQVQHWFTSEEQNIISVFLKSGNKLSVYLLDGFTGRVLEEHIQVPYTNDMNVLPLDSIVTDAGEQSSYVVLDGSDNVLKVLPFNDQAALSNFDTVSEHLVHWTVSNDRKSILGLKLGRPGHASTLQWKVQLIPAASKMRILDISHRDKNEAIYSAAKPVFGGGVLLKNINPNALLVIAGGDEDSSGLVVTALDAFTGRIIYRQEHQGGNGPVSSIVSEHWAAYNFWQETQSRWYIGVIDTYYPQPEDLTAMKLLFSRGDANETVSPYDTRPELIVESESFRTKFAASCLAVTKTSHGTTSKMLLMGTTEGQIVSIDRRMLDPRRPKVLPGAKPTPEQVYERLPPYQPEIGVSGPSFITLYHRIERLRGIETHPATLESSTLVFAHGLDMYFIRMQPSRGFDMVPDDFPHALLVFMVVGLALALSILRKVIQKRTLRLTWK